jgi:hypothetical protein
MQNRIRVTDWSFHKNTPVVFINPHVDTYLLTITLTAFSAYIYNTQRSKIMHATGITCYGIMGSSPLVRSY